MTSETMVDSIAVRMIIAHIISIQSTLEHFNIKSVFLHEE